MAYTENKGGVARTYPSTFPCEGNCGRMLRRVATSVEDYPGTVIVQRDWKCARCARQEHGEKLALPPTYTCEGTCGRTLRRREYTLDQFPGTIRVARQGRCGRCAEDLPVVQKPRFETPPAEIPAHLDRYMAERHRRIQRASRLEFVHRRHGIPA